MVNNLNKSWIVFLATYPPRECGIATFTEDLALAFNKLYAPGVESKVVAMNVDDVSRFNYSKKVIYQINQSEPEDYIKVARQLNSMSQVKLVNIQHEFGIFGGEWGKDLMYFMEAIKKPVAITFHSVLPKPDEKVLDIVQKLAASSNIIMVFTKLSKDILVQEYDIDDDKIRVVPHGIHPVPFTDPIASKNALGLARRTVLTSFGLLSEGKGIEYVIESLPKVVKKFPKIIYLVLGATHPLVVKKEGEKYRNSLIKKVYDLGLQGHVRFYDKYLELEELLEFLKATDIYISSALNPAQAVSGTLSYALGTGRPVISTAFAQAKEDITPNVGALVDFRKPSEFTAALDHLLSDPSLMTRMGKNAYFKTRNMTWPNVTISYMRHFGRIVSELGNDEKYLPKIKLKHVIKLTDDFGMIQFAKMDEPDISSGYTVDDNARAMIFCALYYEKFKTPSALKLVVKYLNFIEFVRREDGYFENYVDQYRKLDHKKNRSEDLEDATARALYALAVVATNKAMPKKISKRAKSLFQNTLNKNPQFTHLRSSAFYIKGLSLYVSKWRDSNAEQSLIRHCDFLMEQYQKNSDSSWQWFADHLTYANAIIPDALLSAYPLAGENKKLYYETGKKTLDFLIAETFKDGVYLPIGQREWYKRGGKRSIFDQQPEDASSMVWALRIIYDITKDKKYNKFMHQAFGWYLGNNILHQIIYDESTGGCNDGIGESDINLNQGAESTVSYLLARLMLFDL